ncbi:phosphatase PAP2 family protein [Stackebrandtia soli]|uniref:phosphatase PAP2 family protein n=1 Tax=Stackebrandtia soli TaxID=1892856 RepID=UPI0039E9B8A9
MPPQLDSAVAVAEDSATPNLAARWRRIVAPAPAVAAPAPRWEPYSRVPASWKPDVLMALGIAVITISLLWDSPIVWLDVAVREFFLARQIPWLHDIALAVTYLGSGRLIAPIVLLAALWCSFRYKSIRPLLMYIVCYLPLGVILGLKHLFGRTLSHLPDVLTVVAPEGPILFEYVGTATAYPSGHAANTIVWYCLAVLLVGGMMGPRLRWVVLVAPAVLVLAAQNYVGQHWLSDAPTGFMMGALIVRSIKRVPWGRIPLGPLQVFEPVSTATLGGATLMITGLLLAAALPGFYGFLMASVVVVLGLTWLVVRHRRGQ